jgi:hypothetical protein
MPGSPAASNREQQWPVAGSVASATTGEPIHKASVKLFRPAEGPGSAIRGTHGATTDASGNYQARVDAGRYIMSVNHNGYAEQRVGRVLQEPLGLQRQCPLSELYWLQPPLYWTRQIRRPPSSDISSEPSAATVTPAILP